MALLKEDGSLDVERINKLPIDEYMKVIGELTESQYKEYRSATPINESYEPIKPIIYEGTYEEDVARNGGVLLEDKIRRLKEELLRKNEGLQS